MRKKTEITDFYQLALALKPTLFTHNVPLELHYSLISDIMFQFANFVDESTGSSFHEAIDALLDEHAEELSAEVKPTDWLVAELEVHFGKGKMAEANILRSHLMNRQHLNLDLEICLSVRDISEIGKDIDTDSRFADLIKRKNGIKSLRFKAVGADAWLAVPLSGKDYGGHEQSLEGICTCIVNVTKQWV